MFDGECLLYDKDNIFVFKLHILQKWLYFITTKNVPITNILWVNPSPKYVQAYI